VYMAPLLMCMGPLFHMHICICVYMYTRVVTWMAWGAMGWQQDEVDGGGGGGRVGRSLEIFRLW
jgi:hypothetical protein